ncbi:MAG: hypothetical protein Q4D81_12595 [Eubacteriales bacterium]|nr:hypothetical protein [Eubacteriales bacterium]
MRKNNSCTGIICVFLAVFLLTALTAAGAGSISARAEEKAEELDEAYVYRQEDGHLKYWLDLRGDDLLLHCMFRYGDPTYHEKIYTFDITSAEASGKTILIRKITDDEGLDLSLNFAFLSVTFVNNKATMSVVRDEDTLAGGASGNLLTGSYVMDPGVPEEAARSTGTQGARKAVKELLAAENTGNSSGEDAEGLRIYTPQQLCEMAQEYYNRHYDYYPPLAEYEKLEDGRYRIHLYEVVDDGGGVSHTGTSAWYTVDDTGKGTDDLFGGEIDLTQ